MKSLARIPRRIFSLETEYALMQEGTPNNNAGGRLYDRLEPYLRARHATATCDTVGPRRASPRLTGLVELKEGFFLDTGARVYYDTGHVEWACPESGNAIDATVWDMAADRELEDAARQASNPREGPEPAGRILVIKNNIDYTTHATYGCHENYSISRNLPPLREALTAFLVTRTILCGAGRFGASPANSNDGVAFQISQRADFIGHETSKDTRDGRAILNERDEPLADPSLYRRLHIILADSNLSPWSNLIKLGTTGLVLDALELGAIQSPPVLEHPVEALREISRDLQCDQPYPLRGGGRSKSVEIQKWYCQVAARVLESAPLNDPRREILRLWEEALDDLAAEPARLADRSDWRIKYSFFERDVLPRLDTSWDEIAAWTGIVGTSAHLPAPFGPDIRNWLAFNLPRHEFAATCDSIRGNGLDWRDYPRQRKNYFTLRALDVRFHDLDAVRGFFHRQTSRDGLPGITPETIETARREPPRQTRAWLRGRVLRSPSRQALTSLDWDCLHLADGSVISLPDPFAVSLPEVDTLFALTPEEAAKAWRT